MISYERIGCSKGIDFNKSKESIKCIICGYYYFKDIGFKYQPYVCNECHDFSMTVMNLTDFFIRGVNYRVYISGINKKEAVNILNNSELGDKGVLIMEFRPNISPVDVIKKGAFGGTYFRDIYSGVTGKFHKNSWKEFSELKSIYKKYYASDFYDVKLNCYGVEVGTSLRFWESENWIRPIDPYGWFQIVF